MRRTAAALLALAAGACGSSFDVIVTDLDGRPIEGAEVVAKSASVNSAPLRTDRNGRARLSTWETRWVAVQAPGYEADHRDRPADGSLRVPLAKTPAVGTSYELLVHAAGKEILGTSPWKVYGIGDIDARWALGFTVLKRISGDPPVAEGRYMGYAVHSPARTLPESATGRYRLRATVVPTPLGPVHQVHFTPE